MEDEQVYPVRRAILREMKSYEGAPVTAAQLAESTLHPALKRAGSAAVAEQWTELRLYGYIESIEGFGGLYCRITEKGLRQLSVEFAQDPFIHGPGAIR